MKIETKDGTRVTLADASATLDSGETLVVAFKDAAGEYQVIEVAVQGRVCVITHEQTGDALVVRRNKAQFVKA
jgi:hypothetical protein